MKKNRLFIIGSTKCGTTSLHHYLSQTEIIVTSHNKETRYYLDETYPLPRDDYQGKLFSQLFPKHAPDKVLLDSTPDYLYQKNIFEKLKQTNDSFSDRFVVIVRNPVDRFVSWFEFAKQIGEIDLNTSLEEFIGKQAIVQNEKTKQYQLAFNQGFYLSFIQKYINNFGKNNILVVHFDTLKSNPELVVEETLRLHNITISPNELKKIDFGKKNVTFKTHHSRTLNEYKKISDKIRSLAIQSETVMRASKKIKPKIDAIVYRLLVSKETSQPLDNKSLETLSQAYEKDWEATKSIIDL